VNKNVKKWYLGFFCTALCVFGVSCASNPQVSRVNSSTQTDLSGYWNDTDVRIVCEALINDCLNSPRMTQALAKFKGKTPKVIVGNFSNDSDEHIDTSIIAMNMESTIFNSGKLDFVAGGKERGELRQERLDQQGNASEATAKALANETGASFMLSGAVKTIVDQAGNRMTRTYFVNAQMTDLETNERVWLSQNSDIKKIIVRPKNKF
jgi:uncharacterized protein (TIGR02722 family)